MKTVAECADELAVCWPRKAGIHALEERRRRDARNRVLFFASAMDETERMLRSAQTHGVPVIVHADQLSDMGETTLATSHGLQSCDSLEHLSDGCIADLRKDGLPMALSTGHGPGTSPARCLLLMMNMKSALYRGTVPKVLAGETGHDAHAGDVEDSRCRLGVGCRPDFVPCAICEVGELAYWLGCRPTCIVLRHVRIAPEGPGACHE